MEESISKLRSRGIGRVVIVTGHLRHFYDDLRSERDGLITVHNPWFADSGSMSSLACARDLRGTDFLLLESDLVYESRARMPPSAHSTRAWSSYRARPARATKCTWRAPMAE